MTAEPMESYTGWDTGLMLRDLLLRVFPGRIALVTSFGAESAVLLHLAAEIDRSVPVIFLDTGKLFPETLAYRDRLTGHLGLRDVRSIQPDPRAMAAADPGGDLWNRDSDLCCWHRKVEPLSEALAGFAAWINGRKRFQGADRTCLPLIERMPDGVVKANPLANWPAAALARYMAAHGLPRHELSSQGFGSIGCTPCTRPVAAGEQPRAGRWSGRGKTECGIHLAGRGAVARASGA